MGGGATSGVAVVCAGRVGSGSGGDVGDDDGGGQECPGGRQEREE